MPFAELADGRIHYRLEGPDTAAVVVFSNSLGTDYCMWDPQFPALAKKFRILRYDTRGHGQSSVTTGPYSIEQLGKDVVRLLDSLRLKRVNFCGLSMGGMIGMWLGINAPARLDKLILCSTAAKIGTEEMWNARIATVQEQGMKTIAAAAIERWFTPEFREKNPAAIAPVKKMLEEANAEGYVASSAAVRDFDFRDKASGIGVLTLAIAGAHDPATTPTHLRFLADQISGARYVELSGSHLCNVEDSERFNSEACAFLEARGERQGSQMQER